MNETDFAHRSNSDGSYDSVCYQRFTTVASARSESALARAETEHTCNHALIETRDQTRVRRKSGKRAI